MKYRFKPVYHAGLIALGLFVPRLAFAACAAVSVTTATSVTNNWGANSAAGPLLEGCQTLVDMLGAQLMPNAAALSDTLANPTTTVIGALDQGWDATNSVWRRRWVLPGTGVSPSANTDGAGQPLYDKATYRIAGGPTSTFATSATDWITVTGSASKTVRITNVTLCGIATGNASTVVQIIKRSTADTGGTSTSVTPLPDDSSDAAATATAAVYTVNPTLGTTAGNHDVFYLNLNPTGTAGCASSDNGTRNGQALVLRGTAQQMAINFAGTTLPAGASITWRIEETEGATTD